MVGIVDLDQAGGVEVIGIDDAAIILVVFAVQQGVDLAGEGRHMVRVGGLARAGFAQRVEVPSGRGIQASPEGGKLFPGQQAVERAVEQAFEFGGWGSGQGAGLHGSPSV